jgi:uncharacterized protein YcnI
MRTAWLRIMALSTFLTLAAAGAAWAHVEISPSEVPSGTREEFVAEVPAELDVPTTEVRLEVPEGFEVTNVSSPSGWQGNLSGRSIVWSGGEIPPDEVQEFAFEARAPGDAGEFRWRAFQTYEDGTVVEWTGAEDSEEPAPVVKATSARGASGMKDEPQHGDKGHHGTLPNSGGIGLVAVYNILGVIAIGLGILMLWVLRRSV